VNKKNPAYRQAGTIIRIVKDLKEIFVFDGMTTPFKKQSTVVSLWFLVDFVTIMVLVGHKGTQRRHKVHKVEESRIELQNAEESDTTQDE
jgi:hypothetical protein